MLNVKILGSNAVVTTPIAFSDLEKVAKLKSDLLTIKDENGKEVYKFAVNPEGKSAISKYGASFATRNAEGFAELNIAIDESIAPEDRVNYIKEQFGYNILKLSEAVAVLQDCIATFSADLEMFENAIEVVG